ncbi:hypothetical protein N7475_003060 [Penicillium sp. IBT 31633x]|nr:hypothetical protein N7475_003060 [Penicillium sp. IBT 31633x]
MIKGPCKKSELAAMRYVAKHTSIPIPNVLKIHHYNDDNYVEMDFVQGVNLEAAWHRDKLSEDQKKHIIVELGDYISQLRRLEPPREGIVASAGLDEALDHRVGCFTFGPFATHQGFHSYLRAGIPLENCDEGIGPEVTKCHSRTYRSCFTHADIAPRNIMINDGKISAIIDWEFGGWYPEYWEYTKAHYGRTNRQEWYDGLENAMERYDNELKAEQILWRRLDEPQLLWRGREHLIPTLDPA